MDDLRAIIEVNPDALEPVITYGPAHLDDAQRAQALVDVRHAFRELRLHRVEAACLPSNAPSRRVLEKAGYLREGVREGEADHAHQSQRGSPRGQPAANFV